MSLFLAGCAGTPGRDSGTTDQYTEDGAPLQCVPYAREQSHIRIYGDAHTWWGKAAGRYARAEMPSDGAVMVLHNYAGPRRAHLAVVKRILNPREIRIDHANWLDDGAIYLNNPVRDVSPDNDWSAVTVYNIRNGAWGTRIYPVQGFIRPEAPGNAPGNEPMQLARAQMPDSGLRTFRGYTDTDGVTPDDDNN